MNPVETECLSSYFDTFRKQIVGIDTNIPTPFGNKKLIYADWTASGRLYAPIEKKISELLGPYVANTHSETSFTGMIMTQAYHQAREKVKEHLQADDYWILIQAGYGMTSAVNKLQRLLGLKVHEKYREQIRQSLDKIPVVFVSHMEHHSNHTSWLETLADVVVIPYGEDGFPDLNAFEDLLKKYQDRPLILALTACSNVTGLEPPVHQMTEMIHRYGGLSFLDYACSAPYVDIHLSGLPEEKIPDAVTFSPHKFLGGPGTGGILVMKKKLYQNRIPDHPGGGTVIWTDPWEGREYFDNPEIREDGGTPGFLQMIKTALAIQLKEQMGTDKIRAREEEILGKLLSGMESIPGIKVLEGRHKKRLGVISFLNDKMRYGLMIRLLNDMFGIQSRGGCSCAGTYGHYLLGLDKQKSAELRKEITQGHPECKPGWTRISIHPTMSDEEVDTILEALEYIIQKGNSIAEKYYKAKGADFWHKDFDYQAQAEHLLKNVFSYEH